MVKMLKYTIIIEKARSGEAENNYSAYCPDIPGCVATSKRAGDPSAYEKGH